MANRVCSVCGIQESFVGNRIRIVTVDGKDYCLEHAPNNSPKIQEIPVMEVTQSQRMAILVDAINLLNRGQQQQINLLKSINGYLTFFLVLTIIGIVIGFFSAILP